VLKPSRAISHVNVELKINVSDISSVSIATLMMESAEISETLVSNSTLTRLIAREEFSTLIRSESFKYLISDIRFYSYRIRKIYGNNDDGDYNNNVRF
jgi:hypothetical protein